MGEMGQLPEWKSIPGFPLVIQLIKTEKSGGKTTFGNTLYFSHVEFEGTAYATGCTEKMLIVSVEFTIGLCQWFSALAVYYNYLENQYKKDTNNQAHSKPPESESLQVGWGIDIA